PRSAMKSTMTPKKRPPMGSKQKGSPEHSYHPPVPDGQEHPEGPGARHGYQVYPGMTPSEAGPAGPGPQGQSPKHRMQNGYPPQGAPPPTHGEQSKPEGGKHKKGEKETPPPG